jgi:hypothetical protein
MHLRPVSNGTGRRYESYAWVSWAPSAAIDKVAYSAEERLETFERRAPVRVPGVEDNLIDMGRIVVIRRIVESETGSCNIGDEEGQAVAVRDLAIPKLLQSRERSLLPSGVSVETDDSRLAIASE